MDIDIRERWVVALESGEYKQGTNALANDKLVLDDATGRPALDENGQIFTERRYCCLGVLCELAKREGVISDYDETRAFLPDDVQAWAGLGTPRPEIPLEAITASDISWLNGATAHAGYLDILNDNGCEFPRIAELIRAHL